MILTIIIYNCKKIILILHPLQNLYKIYKNKNRFKINTQRNLVWETH